MEEQIKQKIQTELGPTYLELENQSHMHAGHAGDDGSGQTHFKLMVVSGAFNGCNRVQRHKIVYAAVDGLFEKGLHAFSIVALTPAEYSQK